MVELNHRLGTTNTVTFRIERPRNGDNNLCAWDSGYGSRGLYTLPVLSLLYRVDTRIPFEPFADRLIGDTGLKWTSRDMTYHRMFLHGAIQRMVIHILAAFGIVEREYQDKPLGKGTIPELVAFQVTPFGKRLLESLK